MKTAAQSKGERFLGQVLRGTHKLAHYMNFHGSEMAGWA